jgi:serine/threonine protein kinase
MIQSLSSQAYQRTSKIGMWHKCFVTIHDLHFYLTKCNRSRKNFFDICIHPEMQIDSSKSEETLRIQVHSKKFLYVKFESKELAQLWKTSMIEQINTNATTSTPICLLGRGNFATVELIQTSNGLIAQKSVQKNLVEKCNLEVEEVVLAERDCLMKCQHPFIVQLKYYFQTSSNYCYGLEYLSGGDLSSLMKRVNLSLSDVKLYLAEIGLALSHIHSKGFAYRDLKPENILIGEDGHLKLIDFGFALNVQENGLAKSLCGTSSYVSPEAIEGIPYDYSCDWWSFGVLAYQLLCKELPFSDETTDDLFWKIQNEDPIYPSYLDRCTVDFLSLFLVKQPTIRATLNSTKNHPFWKVLNFDEVLNKKDIPKYFSQKTGLIEDDWKKYLGCEKNVIQS